VFLGTLLKRACCFCLEHGGKLGKPETAANLDFFLMPEKHLVAFVRSFVTQPLG
jgi:hypothetical protein